MFLNDAFGNTDGLKCIYHHHEQGAAMAALGYSKLKGIGVCVTTTGCGATNTITGLLDAWQDSQPVLFISGQVKKKETTYFSGLPLRSFGIQEVDIIPIVKSLTKYAVCLGCKEEYFDCLERIPELLYSGRPGPVWIDIPMDIQSQELSYEESSTGFGQKCHEQLLYPSLLTPSCSELVKISEAIEQARRPVFLVGNGLRLSNGGKGIDIVYKYCLANCIPVVSTYLGADFFSSSFPNYLGVCGLKAARRANIALYNADLVIAIGTRLATSVIGFEYEKFAPNAQIYIVDIDEIEHSKKTRSGMQHVVSDAYSFIHSLASLDVGRKNNDGVASWLKMCTKMKDILPIQEQFSPSDAVSIYDAVAIVCENCGDSDVLVSDAGSAYYVSSIMFKKRVNQRYITSGAQADMGFSLPASIGAAAGMSQANSRVHALTGDGSFQLNIQELQTLATNKLPITIYVLNNNGYLSIRATQSAFFPGRECGTDPSTGVEFPNLRMICEAYQIEYQCASDVESLSTVVRESSHKTHPVVCEVLCPQDEAIIPRTKTLKRRDGTLESAPLSDMNPSLSKEIQASLNSLGFSC